MKKEGLDVDLDWGSTGIWEYSDDKYLHGNLSYASLRLPPWLIERFDYWTWWFNRMTPETGANAPDDDLFEAYGLSLAIDLKLWVGERFDVYYRKKKIELPVPATVHQGLDARCPAKEMDNIPRPFLKRMVRCKRRHR
ncbi:MAG: hypothetical protein NTY01_00695 [Verrucomicrobia bacterium]|nr:hypothetical protein [Verrucomicrobiota bacterium]